MKTLTIVITGLMMTLSHNSAIAAVAKFCAATQSEGPELNSVANCWNEGTNSVVYYNNYGIRSCNTCDDGFLRVRQTITVPGCTNIIEYYTCECNCTNCENGSFTNSNTGYQSREIRSCSCASGSPVCRVSSYQYRCAAGYYGSSSNGTSGCTKCTSEDGAAATSPDGTTARTGCYIPSGTAFSNTSGQGTFTGNTYWCN